MNDVFWILVIFGVMVIAIDWIVAMILHKRASRRNGKT